jgi:hypothetical protein
MRRSALTRQRLVVLFFVGLALLFSPVVLLFEGPRGPFGIPLLYLYLFCTWAALIALTAWVLASGPE